MTKINKSIKINMRGGRLSANKHRKTDRLRVLSVLSIGKLLFAVRDYPVGLELFYSSGHKDTVKRFALVNKPSH